MNILKNIRDFAKTEVALLLFILIGFYSLDIFYYVNQFNNPHFLNIGSFVGEILFLIAAIYALYKQKSLLGYIIMFFLYINVFPNFFDRVLYLNFNNYSTKLFIDLLIYLYLFIIITSLLLTDQNNFNTATIKRSLPIVLTILFIYVYQNINVALIIGIPIGLAVLLNAEVSAYLLSFSYLIEQLFVKINAISKNTQVSTQILGLTLVSFLIIYLIIKFPKTKNHIK